MQNANQKDPKFTLAAVKGNQFLNSLHIPLIIKQEITTA